MLIHLKEILNELTDTYKKINKLELINIFPYKWAFNRNKTFFKVPAFPVTIVDNKHIAIFFFKEIIYFYIDKPDKTEGIFKYKTGLFKGWTSIYPEEIYEIEYKGYKIPHIEEIVKKEQNGEEITDKSKSTIKEAIVKEVLYYTTNFIKKQPYKKITRQTYKTLRKLNNLKFTDHPALNRYFKIANKYFCIKYSHYGFLSVYCVEELPNSIKMYPLFVASKDPYITEQYINMSQEEKQQLLDALNLIIFDCS